MNDENMEQLVSKLLDEKIDIIKKETDLLIANTFRLIIKGMHTIDFNNDDLKLIYDSICAGQRLPDLVENTAIGLMQHFIQYYVESKMNDYMTDKKYEHIFNKIDLDRKPYEYHQISQNPFRDDKKESNIEIKSEDEIYIIKYVDNVGFSKKHIQTCGFFKPKKRNDADWIMFPRYSEMFEFLRTLDYKNTYLENKKMKSYEEMRSKIMTWIKEEFL